MLGDHVLAEQAHEAMMPLAMGKPAQVDFGQFAGGGDVDELLVGADDGRLLRWRRRRGRGRFGLGLAEPTA